jgi:hypothetical protein
VWQGFEYAAPAPDCALDNSTVYQEQQHDRPPAQMRRRPEFRMRQIIFQVQAGVPNRLFEQGDPVLVVFVSTIMSKSADPES